MRACSGNFEDVPASSEFFELPAHCISAKEDKSRASERTDDRMQKTITLAARAKKAPNERPARMAIDESFYSSMAAARRWRSFSPLKAVGRPLTWAAVVIFAACSPTLPAVRVDGRIDWHRIESDHFIVESNRARVEDVVDLTVELEMFIRALGAIPILGQQFSPRKTLVVAFDDRTDYRWFAVDRSDGRYFDKTPIGSVIALPMSGALFGRSVLKHELTHLILSNFLPNAPDWLDEGLASVMETAKFNARTGMVIFGAPSRELLRRAATVRRAGFVDLFVDWPAQLRTELYGASWLLVHYLIDRHPDAFLAFERGISRGLPWTQAWRQHLPLPLADLRPELYAYLEDGRFKRWTAPVSRPKSDSLTISRPSEADIYALRALLYLVGSRDKRTERQRRRAARRDLGVALQADPGNRRAQQIERALSHDPT